MPSFGYSSFAPIMYHPSPEDDKSKTCTRFTKKTKETKETIGTQCTRDTKTCLTMFGGYSVCLNFPKKN